MIKDIHNSKYQSLIAWLKAERLNQDLTLRQAGALMGEGHQFVEKVEKSQRKLNVYEYIQYCEALSLDPCHGFNLLSQNKKLSVTTFKKDAEV